MTKLYLARAMSGRSAKEVYEEALWHRSFFKISGFNPLDPVEEEGVQPHNKNIQATKEQMDKFWVRDKQMIRSAHVFVDCSPHLKSQGVEREAGFARYHLWKPVVRLFPHGQLPGSASVAYYEDDLVVDNLGHAVLLIKDLWGTPWKRLKWKLKIIKKSCLKAFLTRINWFVNWL